MKLKIFMVAIAACIPTKWTPSGVEGTAYSFHVGLTVSFTGEAAEAWGIEAAKRQWPESEGFYCHKASVEEVPVKDVRGLLAMIDTGEFDVEHTPEETGELVSQELPM